MPRVTILIDKDEEKILKKRAKKNLMTVREQIEDIIRRSCVRSKSKKSTPKDKTDDKLVRIFSRTRRGRPRKKKAKKKSK
jgi:hypothetical protein